MSELVLVDNVTGPVFGSVWVERFVELPAADTDTTDDELMLESIR